MKFNELITTEEKNEIVKRIKEKAKRFNEKPNGQYDNHRKKHNNTQTIFEAFLENENIGTLIIKTKEDDVKFRRPVFVNDNVRILILNDSSSKNAKYLKEFYELNKNGFKQRPIFYYFYCCFNKNKNLTSIRLRLPKEDASIFHEEYLYKNY